MIAKEILEIISKLWRSNQDIMKIANVSASTASKTKNLLRKNLERKSLTNLCLLIVYLPKKSSSTLI